MNEENYWVGALRRRRSRRSLLKGAALAGAGLAGAAMLACKASPAAKTAGGQGQAQAQPDVNKLIGRTGNPPSQGETPVMGVARVALQDTEIEGCPVHKGENLFVLVGAANTDPEGIEEAGTVDFERSIARQIEGPIGGQWPRRDQRSALGNADRGRAAVVRRTRDTGQRFVAAQIQG